MTRNAVATSLGGGAVIVATRRDRYGPWTTVVDLPDAPAQREPVGPPPGLLALAGIASCTIVTVMGVASRGAVLPRGMEVGFRVERDPAGAVAVDQTTTVEADLDERDRLRLERAAANCPVGKNFTKRGVVIEDHVVVDDASGGPSLEPPAEPSAVPTRDRLFPPGSVVGRSVPETGEWLVADGRRVLVQEGEVRIHLEWDDGGGGQLRAALAGGHTSAGWAPRPSSYAIASLAASSLLTLRSRAAELGIDAEATRVEVEVVSDRPAGGKEASQDAAAEGRPGAVVWRRTATVRGPAAIDPEAVRAILRDDPIAGVCTSGDLLRAERFTFGVPEPTLA